MDQIAHRSMSTSLPNILTYGRIVAVPVLAGVLFFGTSDNARWLAFAIFVTACLTDWLDGYLARIWAQQSNLGRMLDPIADKLLVGATLLMLVYAGTIGGWSIWAALIILAREILVSGLREFLAELRVSIPVSWLAKWKTTFQLVSLGALILGGALPGQAWIHLVGLVSLWLAAALTLVTGYDYLRTGLRHMD